MIIFFEDYVKKMHSRFLRCTSLLNNVIRKSIILMNIFFAIYENTLIIRKNFHQNFLVMVFCTKEF